MKRYGHSKPGTVKAEECQYFMRGGVKMAKFFKMMFSLIGLGSAVRW
ncbi:MAG: hypothetical protein M1475_07060 [Actinobacteria bacterium]|nr:hypothetical protein [Cyanobacteriota bacterium]MCL6088157.1 hypothetical protein [Actinomycetota bacterium]